MSSHAQRIAAGATGLAIRCAPRPVEGVRCSAPGPGLGRCMGAAPARATIRTPHLATPGAVLRIANGGHGLHGPAAPRSVGVARSRGSERSWWRRTLGAIHVSAPTPKRLAAILTCAPSIVSGTTGGSGAHVARAAMVELARNVATRNGNPPMVDCPAWEMPRTWRSATPIHVPSTALSSYGRVGVNAPPVVAWDPASAHG
mmetsp:Transcript_58343/g.92351  ORF Transcript_58343/g.92351 Transcript_58343/m.92351 type:complete len:201 (-) Transcript_58343:1348-1950(-)